MATPARSRQGWATVVITSAAAALLTAIGTYAVEVAREAHDSCSIAAAVLKDDTLSPYLSDKVRSRVIVSAVSRFERGMKD